MLAKKSYFSMRSTRPFLKMKVLPTNERSAFQLLDAMKLNDKGTINSNKTTAKTHATMDEKITIPLYTEPLHLLITRYGWRPRKISGNYTFEQSRFKKESVIMNQVSRQNAQTDSEKDFYKLMNNLNFGYDCRNNQDNCFFQPIYNEIEELSYAKCYQNVFDQQISDFVSTEILECWIEEEFLNKLYALDMQDEFYKARKNSLEIKKKKEKRAGCCVLDEKIKAKNPQKNSIKDID